MTPNPTHLRSPLARGIREVKAMSQDKIDLPIPGVGVRARINMINSILDDLISHELNRDQVVIAICDLIVVEIKLFNEFNKAQ